MLTTDLDAIFNEAPAAGEPAEGPSTVATPAAGGAAEPSPRPPSQHLDPAAADDPFDGTSLSTDDRFDSLLPATTPSRERRPQPPHVTAAARVGGAADAATRGCGFVRVNVTSNLRDQKTLGMSSKTYFVINVDVPAEVHYAAPVVPAGVAATGGTAQNLVSPHLRAIHYELSDPVEWRANAQYVVQRRYSEVGLLRELLTYQFPMLLIPPLAPKSIAENLETSLNHNVTLAEQQAALQFFFTNLTCLPEVMAASQYVKAFLTQARGEFETATKPRMMQKIEMFRLANRPVDQFSGVRKEFESSASAAATAITNQATKMIRSVWGFFSSSATATAPGVVPPAATPLPAAAAAASRPADVQDDMNYWNDVSARLTVQRSRLKEMATVYGQYLERVKASQEADLDVARAVESFASELLVNAYGSSASAAPAGSGSAAVPSVSTVVTALAGDAAVGLAGATPAILPPLHNGMTAMATTMKESTELFVSAMRLQYMEVCTALRMEAAFMKAILYRVDEILALYAYIERANVYEPLSPAWDDALHAARALSRGIRAAFEGRYLQGYDKRMRMCAGRIVAPYVECVRVTAAKAAVGQNALEQYVSELPTEFIDWVTARQKREEDTASKGIDEAAAATGGATAPPA